MDGDPVAGLESPVEEMLGQAGHRGVELGVSNAALDRPDGNFAWLLFGVLVQEVIQRHGSILYGRYGESSCNGLGGRYTLPAHSRDLIHVSGLRITPNPG